MKKLLAVALLLMFLMPLAAVPAFAADKVVDAGNKLCPISGDSVSGSSFVEYQGKRYGLCCPACKKAFLNDPERYVARAETEKVRIAQPVAALAAADSAKMEKDMDQGSL